VQILILLLLVVALALLVLALVGGNSALAACSVAASLIAVAFVVRGRQQRAEQARTQLAEAERLARLQAELDESTRVLAAAAAEAGRRAAAAPRTEHATPAVAAPVAAADQPAPSPERAAGAPGSDVADEVAANEVATPSPERVGGADDAAADEAAADEAAGPPIDEPPAADTLPLLDRHGQARVWVIDGRPRYHLAECAQLDGSAEPISLAQAVEDGFTPCANCDPDNRITS